MKKLMLCIILTIAIAAECFGEGQALQEPVVNARGAILMDFETGRVLWEKNANSKMSMASTTKIMTAIIALEQGNLKDVVTVSSNAASAPRVKMYLKTGEQQRLEDLLYALMLESSNDAAVAIAEHLGKDTANFCEMMTQKAREIGAFNTSFKTPNGLDAEGHYSTAYDLAVIAKYALQNDDFVRIINTPYVNTPVGGGDFKPYYIMNKNRLLNEFEGAIGVKTGFTGQAGQCFVGAAKRGDLELISVVLASGWGSKGKEQKWIDTKRILNYGFDNYKNTVLLSEGEYVKDIDVSFARETSAPLFLKEGLAFPVREDELENIRIVENTLNVVEAPLKEGDKLGYVKDYIGDVKIGEIDLIAKNAVERHDFNTSMRKILDSLLNLELYQ